MRKKFSLPHVGLMAALVLGGAVSASAGPKTIAETAQAAGSFNTLLAAVEAAGLSDALGGSAPLTVFAPTDEAFSALPEGTVEALLNDIPKLTNILLYHVVDGVVMAEDVAKLESATTLLGQPVSIDTTDGVKIAGAEVVKADIKCSNGVIHVIDQVILPKNLAEVATHAGIFSTLLAAADAAGLVDTLSNSGPFTVFAPTDDAFAKLPANTVSDLLKPENKDQLVSVLTYHVVPGIVKAADVVKLDAAASVQGSTIDVTVEKDAAGAITGVMVDKANVTATDIIASNGVIHVIDAVILPQSK